ncbi:MAG: universal stress protein [Thermodesulfobacteriota bacterium]
MKNKKSNKEASLFNKVLVPLDSSANSNSGMKMAIELAKKYEALLVGTHVYAARLHEDRFKQMESGLPPQYQQEDELERQRDIHNVLIDKGLQLIADSYFSTFAKECQEAGIKVSGKNLEGKNFAEIAKETNNGDYDLVVMGFLGLGAVEHSIVGTVCERVLRQIRTDCLVVKEDRPLGGDILVAIDGSPSSYWGIKVAISIQEAFGGEIEAVSVFDPHFHQVAFKSIADILSSDAKNVFKFEEQEALHDEIIDKGLAKIYQEHLDRAAKLAEMNGAKIKTNLLAGKPYNEIIKHLRWKKYSLLITGRHGIHTPELDLGGNTENLLRMAPCNMYISSREYELPEEFFKRPESQVEWEDKTVTRLDKVPFFARGMAKKAIEDFAQERGIKKVTEEVFSDAVKKLLPPSARRSMGIE